MSTRIAHANMVKPIMDDGFIHMGHGDVIRPEVFAKALAENRLVDPGTVVVDHERREVRWVHHMTEALAESVAKLPRPQGVSMGMDVEQSFLNPQVFNTDEPKKA